MAATISSRCEEKYVNIYLAAKDIDGLALMVKQREYIEKKNLKLHVKHTVFMERGWAMRCLSNCTRKR